MGEIREYSMLNIKACINKFVVYLSVTLSVLFLTFQIKDPDFDLWARLAVGSIFFQTGQVLKHDIFTYSPTKNLWIDHEWGTGVLFFNLIHYFGEKSLFIFKAFIILAIFILIVKIYRLQSEKISNEPLYIFLVAFSLYSSLASQVRSQIFTFLFFILWIYVLERVRRGENRLLWILPATMLLWVNLHGGFAAGLGLILIYALGEFFNKKNPAKYLITFAVTLLVTLINPYGINLWYYLIQATMLERIGFQEWQPIDLINGPVHIIKGIRIHVLAGPIILAVLSVISFARLAILKIKPDFVKILLIIITFYLGWKHQRHIIFFTLAASSLLYPEYARLFQSFGEMFTSNFYKGLLKLSGLIKNVIIYAFIIWIIFFILPLYSAELSVFPNFYPVGSFEFIKQNKLSGNLGITYNWGSYALWKLYPQCKVLMDGRYEELYPNETYLTVLNFSEHVNNNWARFLNISHTDIIIAPKKAYLRSDLDNLANWQIVYEDGVSYLLLPKNKVKKSYIYPNAFNTVYWKEDFKKQVDLN